MEIKARPPVPAPAATEPTSSVIDERLLQYKALEEARKEREELERKKKLLEQQRQRLEKELPDRRIAQVPSALPETVSSETTSMDQQSAVRTTIKESSRSEEQPLHRDLPRVPVDEGRWERAKPPPAVVASPRQPIPM